MSNSIFSSNDSAALLLSDGTLFLGSLCGAKPETLCEGILGEVVFNTAMTGYQEILSDPSYLGQIVVMTYPHIGNYGTNEEDQESRATFAAGLVAHEICDYPSNWRQSQSLPSYLESRGIPALTGVDTRALTRHLRQNGSMNGYIVYPAPKSEEAVVRLLKQLKSEAPFGQTDLVAQVTCREPYDWENKGTPMQSVWNMDVVEAKDDPTVVVIDLGVKQNMLRSLAKRGCRVRVVPASTSAADILNLKPNGVLLTNGPGDPARVQHVPNTVRELLGKVPVYGICMGHQILAHAIGAKTYKMKFGHHGANQPSQDLGKLNVMITSQNHGYAIDPDSLPKGSVVAEINLNDKTVESIEIPEKKAKSVQYHPEACPGPRDSMGFFDDFMRAMGYGR